MMSLKTSPSISFHNKIESDYKGNIGASGLCSVWDVEEAWQLQVSWRIACLKYTWWNVKGTILMNSLIQVTLPLCIQLIIYKQFYRFKITYSMAIFQNLQDLKCLCVCVLELTSVELWGNYKRWANRRPLCIIRSWVEWSYFSYFMYIHHHQKLKKFSFNRI